MEGLAVLQHHVVGNIDRVGNRSHPGVLQPRAHPAWRRANSNIANDRGGVPGAPFRVFDFNRDFAGDGIRRSGEVQFRFANRHPGQRRHFSGDAEHSQATGHVGQHVQVNHNIAEQVLDRGSRYRIGVVENDDAFVVVRNTKFKVRHAHRIIHDATQCFGFQREDCLLAVFVRVKVASSLQPQNYLHSTLAWRNVRRAGDDGLRFAGTVVELHHLQLVGVRVLGDVQHRGHDDLVPFPNQPRVLGLDPNARGHRKPKHPHAARFQTRNREPLHQLRRVRRERDVILQPLQRNKHRRNPLHIPIHSPQRTQRTTEKELIFLFFSVVLCALCGEKVLSSHRRGQRDT